MPRPKDGYRNAAGQQVPGATDITGRYKEMGALMHWAHSQGAKGLPLYARAAIDIGTCVHHMAELDLKGRPDREIEAYCHECLTAPEHLQAAWNAFNAFRAWRQQCQVRAIAQEASLVSELYQYGGTPDCVALIDGKVSLIDFKTSAKPYAEHLIAMAAHAHLWNERHPDRPIAAFHVICLPKDGSAFQHHAYADLSLQFKIFTLWLEAYRLEKDCSAAVPKKAAAEAKPRRAPRKAASTPAAEAPALAPPAMQNLSMAELLRSYGHVKEAAPC